jgi:hypothetical protein
MKEDFIRRLFISAEKMAGSNNLRLDPKLRKELLQFIRNGVGRMTTEQLRSEANRKAVEYNLLELVNKMSKYAYSKGMNEPLDVSALNAALRGFCPRHPFC